MEESTREVVNDNLVLLDEHRPAPHVTGRARCLTCKHEWVEVAPVGNTIFACSECGHDGAMLGVVLVDPVYLCGCGCDLFRFSPSGAYCIHCGTEPNVKEDQSE